MTSTQGVAVASSIINPDPVIKAGPLLVLLDAFLNARGDPLAEVMVRDVKRFLYSQTEHSDEAMVGFISEAAKDLSHLAA